MSTTENIPILLVDDEEGIRKVLGLTLSDMGYEVYTAGSCESALDIFRKKKPPFILSDIKMPGSDGLTLLRTIKQESPDTEVIMITGHGDMNLAIKSLKFDATDFITKPINDDALEIALRRARERRLMKEQLKQYTENLEMLVKEKSAKLVRSERMAAIGQTVTGLSHTIKNIAGGLKGGAFVLEKGISTINTKYLNDGWRMISGNVNKIARLSLDLLNYAKTAEINLMLVDPNLPVKQALEVLEPRLDSHHITIQTVLESMPAICFDPDGINIVLLTLVENAIDACLQKSVLPDKNKISITSVKTETGVTYKVEDNGCGMNSDVLSKLFNSFFTTKGNQGTGIGLMMAKHIVDMHNGSLDIKSEAGIGTTFVVTIPDGENKKQMQKA
ncbi:MAG: hybrid sensor histidine kinase/response regulator [Desulfobacterales bacterium]|nr:hybrid sensor histidine kinase/response regulator [Desulfobacterales bacterium]